MRLALGEFSDLFLASQRVLPQKLWRLGFAFERPTLEMAFERAEKRRPEVLAPRPAPAYAAPAVAATPARAASYAAHIGAQSTTCRASIARSMAITVSPASIES